MPFLDGSDLLLEMVFGKNLTTDYTDNTDKIQIFESQKIISETRAIRG